MNVEIRRTFFFNNKPVYFQEKVNINPEYYALLRDRLKIKKIIGKNFVRFGKANDGGYIMVDNFHASEGIAYSFGISDDVSWDLDMANRDYEIFQYDMTINSLPQDNEHFHFFSEGIGAVKDAEKSLDTLENFVSRNGHLDKQDMVLKMDVEGAEWDFLYTMSQGFLSHFDQMVFEFHNLIQPKNFYNMAVTLELLKKINATHTLVHLHGNNYGSCLQIEDLGTFPDILELTYLRTDNYTFVDDENIFLPIELDQPNKAGFPEIQLGYWNKFTL